MSDDNERIEPIVEPVATAKPSAISDSIWWNATSRWINEHIRNTPLSASVEAWNHLGGALPKLRRILEDEMRNPSA